MITIDKLTTLINSQESSTLDFKGEMYNFQNERDLNITAKFIKDVISFSNTIRTETGFILFGVREKTDKTNEIIGIENSIDDSILQDKVKDKVFPRPNFSYYEMRYQDKKIGVLEFPITKYEMLLTPALKLKGLECGKAYFRNGTSNTEANAIDTIRINDWLISLPGNLKLTLTDKISELIKRITTNKEKLSTLITDIYYVAKSHDLKELEKLCIAQMQGVNMNEVNEHTYRSQKLIMSLNIIEISPFAQIKVTEGIISKELEKSGSLYEYNFLFTKPILEIEDYVGQTNDNNAFATLKLPSKAIIGKGDYYLYVYIFERNFKALYSNIRQRIIDELMKY